MLVTVPLKSSCLVHLMPMTLDQPAKDAEIEEPKETQAHLNLHGFE